MSSNEMEEKYGPTARRVFSNAFNLKEARMRLGITNESVELFRKKINSSKIVPKVLIDNQIYLFINSCDGDVDKAVKKFEKYYEIKYLAPEFFANRDVDSESFKNIMDSCMFVGLPLTPDDSNLILHQIKSTDPKDYVFDDAVKAFIMKSEAYAYKHGPRNGTVFINDLKCAGFRHMFQPSLSSLSKGLRFLQEASPLDVKAVHILETPWFVSYFMNVLKPFLRIEMLKKIHFHGTNMDWEKFYEEHIPKSHLPSNYGGDLKSIEEMHDEQIKSMNAMQEYFKLEEWQKNYELDQYYEDFMLARAERLRNEN